MNISVIIPTLGRESIKTTLAALDRQTKRAHEVIIVRDENRRGVSWARNQGYAKATGDVIAFTDDDCEPSEQWLESIEAIFTTYRADVVGGPVVDRDPLLSDIRRIRRTTPDVVVEDQAEIVGLGANTAFAREMLQKVVETYGQVYDEQLIAGEDYELMWKVKSLGARIYFNPTQMIHHRFVTPASYVRLQFYRGIGIASLQKTRSKYPGITTHRSILWDEKGLLRKLTLVLTRRIIGPFNAKQFSSTRNYLCYWLGTKVEALGYLCGRAYPKAGWKTYARGEAAAVAPTAQ